MATFFDQFAGQVRYWKFDPRVTSVENTLATMQQSMADMQPLGAIAKQTGTITRATTDASGSLDVVTTFQPSLILFSGIDNADTSVTSDGWDDGTIAVSTYTSSQNVLTNLVGGLLAAAITNKSHINSISVLGGGNGHTAKITALAATKFTLGFTRVGSGRNVTIKYIAIK